MTDKKPDPGMRKDAATGRYPIVEELLPPSAQNCQLNYRTKVTTDAFERWFTLKLFAKTAILALLLAVPALCALRALPPVLACTVAAPVAVWLLRSTARTAAEIAWAWNPRLTLPTSQRWLLLVYGKAVPGRYDRRTICTACWKAVVHLFCYNRHQAKAAGMHQLSPAWQDPEARDRNLLLALSFVALALLALFAPDEAPSMKLRKGHVTAAQKTFAEMLPPAKKQAYLEAAKRDAERPVLHTSGILAWAAALALTVTLTAVSLLFAVWFSHGPALAGAYAALEAPDATEAKDPTKWPVVRNYWRRMMESPNEDERNHLLLGFCPYGDWPVLVRYDMLKENYHLLGAIGAGKTALRLATLCHQVIATRYSSVLVIDMKGSPELLAAARAAAKKARLPFKFFSIRPGDPTYIWNPLKQSVLDDYFSDNAVTEALLNAFGLVYANRYGPDWFSALPESVLGHAVEHHRGALASFAFLQGLLANATNFKGAIREDHEKARHLQIVVRRLARVAGLNWMKGDPGVPDEAWDSRIDIPDMAARKQVVYLKLPAGLEQTSARNIAQLACFFLLTVGALRLSTHRERVTIFCDEFQQVLSDNLQLVLEHGRGLGVNIVAAHQSRGQLARTEGDFATTVDDCTVIKETFRTSDLPGIKELEELSGDANYLVASWKQEVNDGDLDSLSPAEATEGVEVAESQGHRLSKREILRVGARLGWSLIWVTKNQGFAQFDGQSFPMVSDFHVAEEVYKAREKQSLWAFVDDRSEVMKVPTRK